MSFHSLHAFLSMGGHGEFVWSAYGIALVVTVYNFVHPMIQKKRNLEQLKKQLENEEVNG